jgi:hypothetical protein
MLLLIWELKRTSRGSRRVTSRDVLLPDVLGEAATLEKTLGRRSTRRIRCAARPTLFTRRCSRFSACQGTPARLRRLLDPENTQAPFVLKATDSQALMTFGNGLAAVASGARRAGPRTVRVAHLALISGLAKDAITLREINEEDAAPTATAVQNDSAAVNQSIVTTSSRYASANHIVTNGGTVRNPIAPCVQSNASKTLFGARELAAHPARDHGR